MRTRSLVAAATLAILAACSDQLTAPEPTTPRPDKPAAAAPLPSNACGTCIFGPKNYLPSSAESLDRFSAPAGGDYRLIAQGSGEPDTRARIKLNGKIWYLSRENAGQAIDVAVTLRGDPTNELRVLTSGTAGAWVNVRIVPRPKGWQLLPLQSTGPTDMSIWAQAPELQAVFAARLVDYSTGTLWRFDLATDTWTQLPATNWPNGKYRKLIYDGPRHRLLTYWDGIGQVYTLPEPGGAWTAEGSSGNSDEYYEGYGFLNPVTGRLAVFAGYGFGTWKNLFWEWDGTGNQWLNLPLAGAVPDPRFGQAVAVDPDAKRAFLGQRSLGAAAGNYDDLWVVNLQTYAFTNLIGPNTGPDARIGSAMAYAGTTHTLYRFGGLTLYGFQPTADFVSAKPDAGSVSWAPMPTSAVAPGPRSGGGLVFDARRNRLVLISGDLWFYNLPN